MKREIPYVSQMSALLRGNPTPVESIFLGKKKEAARNRRGTGTPAALMRRRLQISPGRDSTPAQKLQTHTNPDNLIHTENSPWNRLPHKYDIPLQVDGSNMVKMRTAASINPVINLSQSLKLAVIGLIVVNHACQHRRKKERGIPLQGEWMMEWTAPLRNNDC